MSSTKMSVVDWYLRSRTRRELESANHKAAVDPEAACRSLARAVRFGRKFPELLKIARWRYAKALAALGRTTESLAELQRLSEAGDADAAAWRLSAQQHEALEQDREAIRAWESVLTLTADDPEAHARLADLFLKTGAKRRALPHVEWLAQSANEEIGPWRRVAELLVELGEISRAADTWARLADADLEARERAISLFDAAGRGEQATMHVRALAEATPDKSQSWARLGRRLTDSGRVSDAVATWRRVLDLSPHDEAAQIALTELVRDLQPPADAIAHYRYLVVLRPQDAGLHKALAILLQESGDREAAVSAWRTLVDLAPDDILGRERLALLLAGLGRAAEALPHLEAHALAQPSRAKLWRRLAAAYEKVAAPSAAVEAWETALGLEPEDNESRQRLVALLRSSGPTLRLANHLRALARADVSSSECWRELAYVLAQVGAPDLDRVEPWRQVLKASANDLEAHEQLAAIFWKAGDRSGALPHLEAVATGRPGGAKTWKRIALCRQEINDTNGEITALQQVAALDPEDQDARQRLATSLWAQGRHSEAAPHLRVLFRDGKATVKQVRRLAQAVRDMADDEAEQASSLSSMGEVFEELALWKHVLASASADREAHVRLGELLWEMNRKVEAEPHLRIVAGASRQAKVWRRFAACLKEIGDVDREYTALGRLAEFEGEDGPAHRRMIELAARRAGETGASAGAPKDPEAIEEF